MFPEDIQDDQDLYAWGNYGRNVSGDSSPLDGYSLTGDVLQLWRIVGELVWREQHKKIVVEGHIEVCADCININSRRYNVAWDQAVENNHGR